MSSSVLSPFMPTHGESISPHSLTQTLLYQPLCCRFPHLQSGISCVCSWSFSVQPQLMPLGICQRAPGLSKCQENKIKMQEEGLSIITGEAPLLSTKRSSLTSAQGPALPWVCPYAWGAPRLPRRALVGVFKRLCPGAELMCTDLPRHTQ